jgi:hypothetical protein
VLHDVDIYASNMYGVNVIDYVLLPTWQKIIKDPFHPIVPYRDYLHYTPRTLQYVNLSKHSNLTNPFHLIFYFPLTIPTGKLPNTGKQLISTKTKDNKT